MGRFEVTAELRHRGAFRTPTRRDIARTPPYMHDRSLSTLEDVVDFYASGGVPNPDMDFLVRPIRLSQPERTALVAFLRALTGSVSTR